MITGHHDSDFESRLRELVDRFGMSAKDLGLPVRYNFITAPVAQRLFDRALEQSGRRPLSGPA